MKSESAAAAVGAALTGAIILGVVTATTFMRHDPNNHRLPDHDTASVTTVRPAPANAAGRVVAARVADSACSTTAVKSLGANTSSSVRNAQQREPAAQANPSTGPMSRDAAIAAAKQVSSVSGVTKAGDPLSARVLYSPATAVQVPYGRSLQLMLVGGDNLPISRDRCTWVVTVHAPYEIASTPQGVNPAPYTAYNVAYDVESGVYESVAAANPDYLPDMIAGTAVPIAR